MRTFLSPIGSKLQSRAASNISRRAATPKQPHLLVWLLLCLVMLIVLFGVVSIRLAQAVSGSVDAFDIDQADVVVTCTAPAPPPPMPCTNPGATNASVMTGAGILGGEREIQVTLLGGSNNGSDVIGSVSSGSFTLDSGATLDTSTLITWDGTDGDPNNALNPTGLGGVDLTNGGLDDAFLAQGVFSDQPFELVITVYTTAGQFSTLTRSFPDIPIPNNFAFLFTDFVPTGGGADFSNVGAITLMITSLAPALDVVIIDFGTTSTIPPTPTSVPPTPEDERATDEPVPPPAAAPPPGGSSSTPQPPEFPTQLPETGEPPAQPWPLLVVILVLIGGAAFALKLIKSGQPE